ncbi:TPA: proteasome subunit alpha, partial [Candidatus Woesearchaeota archaeon]|nr:proteasome subunit alpha [Candidatus Woesearchaeota archaeon]
GTIRLFLTEPYGLYFEYRATIIGEGDTEIDAILQKRYKASLTVDEGIKLGLQAMKEYLKDDFNFERVDAAFISVKDKKIVKLSEEELKQAMK